MPSIPSKNIIRDETDPKTMRACVAEGVADADAGRLSEAEVVYARLRAHIEAIARSKTY